MVINSKMSSCFAAFAPLGLRRQLHEEIVKALKQEGFRGSELREQVRIAENGKIQDLESLVNIEWI